jgi:hypothetical protein
MTGRATATATVLTLALAGCWAANDTGDSAGTLPPVRATAEVAGDGHVCLDLPPTALTSAGTAAASARPRLGSGPVRDIVVCDSPGTERVPGQGEWEVRVERRATTGVRALVDALHLPDVPQRAGVSCLSYADGVPELWVVDHHGHAVLPRWPTDQCGHLRSETKGALATITWQRTGSRRVALVTPQAALDAGCQVAVKDRAAIEAGEGRRGAGSLDALVAARGASVCVYRVTDPTPQGTFERGAKLGGAAWTRLVADLRRTPVASADCSVVGQRFAAILLGEKGLVAVELDGCRRILTPDQGVRRATPAVLADLAAVGRRGPAVRS